MEISGVGPTEGHDGDSLPSIPKGTVDEAITALKAITAILDANYGQGKPIPPKDLKIIANSMLDIQRLETKCPNLKTVLGLKCPGYERTYEGTYSKYAQQAADFLHGTNDDFAKTFATYKDLSDLCGSAAKAGEDWLEYQYPH